MSTGPILSDDNHRAFGVSTIPVGPRSNLAGRIGHRILRELREALPPTLFFFIGFNFIVFTTNLLLADYAVAVSNFMLATVAALVVGKAVLVANAMPLLRRFDRAPLIQPILFKTAVYWVVVFFARLLERFIHFSIIEGRPPGNFLAYLLTTFSWHRFLAISLWIFVLFLMYVTATEISNLLGPGEVRRLLFTYRPSEMQLNRRQRIRELLRLSKLADSHFVEEFGDQASNAHRDLVNILARLARRDGAGSSD